jgi:O-acetyl-ADP-ribose deacetylase (regulator of RNase III)
MSAESQFSKRANDAPAIAEPCVFPYKDIAVQVTLGSLIQEHADAIVCPANSFGYMRGGIAAVIRECAGREVEEEVLKLAPIRVGQAVATTAGALKARWIFHAPTMQEPVEVALPASITAAMRACFDLAWRKRIRSISFPGMGTGTGTLPFGEAVELMMNAIRDAVDRPHTIRHVHLVAMRPDLYRTFLSSAEKLFGPRQP